MSAQKASMNNLLFEKSTNFKFEQTFVALIFIIYNKYCQI